ncbi:transglycosylase domain-containing protein [Bacillaceae bacterium W0354]
MNNNDTKNKWLSFFQDSKFVSSTRITLDVFWHITLFFIILGLITMFFFGGVGFGYFASLVEGIQVENKEDMQKHIYNYEETSHVYFRNNVLLGELPSELHRQEVALEDISDHVIEAIIATEDEYFWEHNGVVPKAIMRALFQEFTNSEVQTGGSTLTQQLIKNQILTNQVSFERKAQEILIALRLENFFDKEEILEAYLNIVPFGRDSSGRNIAGVQAAAQGLFDVDASELNVAQAAYIAGLPQSPFAYTPFDNGGNLKSPESLKLGQDRMKIVLKRMLDSGKIDEKTYNSAINYDIIGNLTDKKETTLNDYPFLTEEVEKRAVDIIMKQMYEADGYTEEDIRNDDLLYEDYRFLARRELRQNGYQIHTTIDKNIYDAFQEVTRNYEYFQPTKYVTRIDPETGEEYQKEMPVEVGAELIENSTGAILAFVGGRDHSRSQINHATYHIRPNGSTMKPLFGYAPALELGIIQPGSPLLDVQITVTDGVEKPWTPSNYVSGQERGIESARVALARSDNIPAARLSYDLIHKKGVKPSEYLLKMGLNPNRFGESANVPSMILGPEYLTVEDNVSAFTTFANGGKFKDAYMIEKIVDKEGNIIFEHESEEVEVFSPQTAYLTIDMMRDVLSMGTATYARSVLNNPNVDWAGKTGTSQYWADAWFVATNPNVTLGTWYGYDSYDVDGDGYISTWENNYMSLTNCSNCTIGYSSRNVRYWAELVNVAAEIDPELITPETKHESPGGIVSRSYCQISGLLPSEACEELGLIRTDLFNIDYVPTERDNSVINGQYVEIGEKVYQALETTPEEFVEEGYFLRPEFLEEMGWTDVDDLSKLLPDNEAWGKLKVPESDIPDNPGQVNSPSKMKLSGNDLTWSHVEEGLVVGYRIYMKEHEEDEFVLVGSTKETSINLEMKHRIYAVSAVDLYGNESDFSKSVNFGDIKDPEPSDDDVDDEQGDDQETGSPGNGGNNGENEDNHNGGNGGNGNNDNDDNSGNDGGDDNSGSNGNDGNGNGGNGDNSNNDGGDHTGDDNSVGVGDGNGESEDQSNTTSILFNTTIAVLNDRIRFM